MRRDKKTTNNTKNIKKRALIKKENQIFLIYKEIQNGAVAKSWLRASWYMGKYLRISSYIRKPFLINDFALWISLNKRKILFYFLSVCVATVWLTPLQMSLASLLKALG
jgi:hypothetical protein